MAPPDSIWHKESLKFKEIFGTREGFEICPNNFSPRPNFSPPCILHCHCNSALVHLATIRCQMSTLLWNCCRNSSMSPCTFRDKPFVHLLSFTCIFAIGLGHVVLKDLMRTYVRKKKRLVKKGKGTPRKANYPPTMELLTRGGSLTPRRAHGQNGQTPPPPKGARAIALQRGFQTRVSPAITAPEPALCVHCMNGIRTMSFVPFPS